MKIIYEIQTFEIPLLNTLILLYSGCTLTAAHKYILVGYSKSKNVINSFLATLWAALLFTALQYHEYQSAAFSLNDGIYGSCFFMLTGFHGFHVILGTVMIFISLMRYIYNDTNKDHHVGFLTSA